MKKFLMFVAVITYATNAIAAEKTCHAGFFCVQNGTYIDFSNAQDWFSSTGPARLATSNDSLPMGYNLKDYDEVWICDMGKYYVKNGEVECRAPLNGILACPGTYPSSEPGASSVFQCFRTTSNGQKEYYKTPNNTHHSYDGNYNTDDVNAILTSLQSALTQANSAAQNLESILKKTNNKINVPKLNKNIVETIDVASATQTPDNNTTNITQKITTSQTTAQSNTATPTTTAPVTIKLSETKSDAPASSPLKKLDFGNLSSIFSADKAAVHNTATGRAALPTNPPRVSHIKKSAPGRATTNGATSTPRPSAQTDTRINNKTKRIASER